MKKTVITFVVLILSNMTMAQRVYEPKIILNQTLAGEDKGGGAGGAGNGCYYCMDAIKTFAQYTKLEKSFLLMKEPAVEFRSILRETKVGNSNLEARTDAQKLVRLTLDMQLDQEKWNDADQDEKITLVERYLALLFFEE